jgi:hypothetical protein
MEDWLEGDIDDLPYEHIINIQLLEIDADKKVVALSKKHRLGIDIDHYIRESNAYALTYKHVFNTRSMKTYPYDYANPEILQAVPDNPLTRKQLDQDWSDVLQMFIKYR